MPESGVSLLTCEHGGNSVPRRYAGLFTHRGVLDSHRGFDIGSLDCARQLARELGLPLIAATTTRLVVDLNRSPGHRALFSEYTRGLVRPERDWILERYYRPYRRRVLDTVVGQIARRGVAVHLSVHSFAPSLNGQRRNTDLGLLYDPRRPLERRFCQRLAGRLRELAPDLRVRSNYPYRGTADGLTTFLRRRFSARHYAGVELEINQAHALAGGRRWRRLRGVISQALAGVGRDGCERV